MFKRVLIIVLTITLSLLFAGTAKIQFDETLIPRNGEGIIPIKISSEDPIAGIQFTLSYDPQQIEIMEPRLANPNEDYDIHSKIGNGKLTTLVFSFQAKPIPADGSTVIEIPVKPLQDFVGDVYLEFEQFILASPQGESMPFQQSLPKVTVSENIPKKFQLDQNYPNPFNPTTNIYYQLPKDADVTLTIYNLLGQEIRTLVDKHQPAGFYSITWDGKDNRGRDVASGEYIYTIHAGTFTRTLKMVLLK